MRCSATASRALPPFGCHRRSGGSFGLVSGVPCYATTPVCARSWRRRIGCACWTARPQHAFMRHSRTKGTSRLRWLRPTGRPPRRSRRQRGSQAARRRHNQGPSLRVDRLGCPLRGRPSFRSGNALST